MIPPELYPLRVLPILGFCLLANLTAKPVIAEANEQSLLGAVFAGEFDNWLDRKVDYLKSHVPEILNKGAEKLPERDGRELTIEGLARSGAPRGTRGGVFVSNNIERLTNDLGNDISNFSSGKTGDRSSWNYNQFKDDARKEVSRNVLDAVPVVGDLVIKIQEKVAAGNEFVSDATDRLSTFKDKVKNGADKVKEFWGENSDPRGALDLRENDRSAFEASSRALSSERLPDTYTGQLVHATAEQSGIRDSQYAYKDPRNDPYYGERAAVYQNAAPGEGAWIELNQALNAPKEHWRDLPTWKPTPKEVTAWHYGMELPEICWEGAGGTYCEKTPRLENPRAKKPVCDEILGCPDDEPDSKGPSKDLLAKLDSDLDRIGSSQAGTAGGALPGESLDAGEGGSSSDKLAMLKSLRAGLGAYRQGREAFSSMQGGSGGNCPNMVPYPPELIPIVQRRGTPLPPMPTVDEMIRQAGGAESAASALRQQINAQKQALVQWPRGREEEVRRLTELTVQHNQQILHAVECRSAANRHPVTPAPSSSSRQEATETKKALKPCTARRACECPEGTYWSGPRGNATC